VHFLIAELLLSKEDELIASAELLLSPELLLPAKEDEEPAATSELLYLCCTSSLLGNSIFELSEQDKKRIRASPKQNVVLLKKYIFIISP
jgi:hypothetical protein